MSNERLLKISCGAALTFGLLLLFPVKGSSQGLGIQGSGSRQNVVRGSFPRTQTATPFLGIPNPPNFQPMLMIGGLQLGGFQGMAGLSASGSSALGAQGMSGGASGATTITNFGQFGGGSISVSAQGGA